MAYLYHNYGDAYKGLKQYPRAERYYQKALAIRKKNEDSKDLLITRNELAALYLQWNRSDTALLLARKSYRTARQKAFAREMQQSAALLADIYERRGDPGRALSYLKTSQALKDSLQERQQTLEVLRLQTRYETAEKENLILHQQNKITAAQLGLKTRNFWIFGLSSLTVMIGATGFLLYQQQRLRNIKQKSENALQLALEKIEHRNKLQQQRLSISRDLHDNIGAQLTFIISAMDNLKHCSRDKAPGLIPRFEHISAFTKETMQELRDTVWAMNKADISLKDLQARIANFIEKAKQAQHAAEVSVEVDETVPATTHFSGIQGLNIYRIIQEATHNALKYAEAGGIQIKLRKSGQKLCVEIRDDGIGFDKQQYIPGNGIRHLHKRAAELGGTVQLTTAPGRGTTVLLSVTLTEKLNTAP